MGCEHVRPGPAFEEFECDITGGTVEEWCGELSGETCIARLALQYLAGTLKLTEITSETEREAIVMAAAQAEKRGGQLTSDLANLDDAGLKALQRQIRLRRNALRQKGKLLPRLRAARVIAQASLDEIDAAITAVEEGRLPATMPKLPRRSPGAPKRKLSRAQLAAMKSNAAKGRAGMAAKREGAEE